MSIVLRHAKVIGDDEVPTLEVVMRAVKRTKIICTVGPTTEDDDVLRQMMLAGMDVARLNFSHGTHEYHRQSIERVRRISKELGLNVAIMTDTKGPEIRTRETEDHEPVHLATGSEVIVTARDVKTAPGLVSLDYETLASELSPGNSIYIDDGLVGLVVKSIEGDDIHCTVTNGGDVGEHKGINVPGVRVNLPAVTEKDREDIRFSCEMGVDAIAASFVRDGDAVREVKELCREYGASDVLVVSKVESSIAVDNLDEIIAASDAVMVARGDLGVEIPPATVPQVQKRIIAKCNEEYHPVIVATQMLDSMISRPRPTRAEVTDVANAIYDGADCVMLSGETAAGRYPVESVRMMTEVCQRAEADLPERSEYHDRGGRRNVSGATGYAAVQAAKLVGAKAVMCPTMSGTTARIVAASRPHLPIIATSTDARAARRNCFTWGVECLLVGEQTGVMQVCYASIRQACIEGYVDKDDLVVVTAGDPFSSPWLEGDTVTYQTSTNLFLIAQVM